MEYTIQSSSKRVHAAIDVICILMIGLGIGGLSMYYYAVKHPQDIIQAQPHVLITPPDSKAGKTKATKPTGKPIIIQQV